jgi:catechol 2,3-dioxygenase-like lactoylglutathione lyase family enzyme
MATAPQQRLAVTDIDHVGINVPDVNAVSAFFADLLGAGVVSDMRPGKIPDAWKTAFHWHKSSEIERVVMTQLADGSKIELFEYSGPEISRVSPHEDDAAETHIAPKAIDIDHSIALLRERKLRMLNDPGTLSDGERWFYFLTPWGSQLELVFPPGSK